MVSFSSFSIFISKQTTIILNSWNPSLFAYETADFKLAFIQSAVSVAKNDRFKKFKIMVFRLDLKIKNDKKRH